MGAYHVWGYHVAMTQSFNQGPRERNRRRKNEEKSLKIRMIIQDMIIQDL